MLVVAGGLLLVYAVTKVNSPVANDSPKMQVQSNGGVVSDVTVTSDDDNPFTITRVVINGRDGEKGCDVTDKPSTVDSPSTGLPATLKRGDQAVVYVACGKTLSVDVYTDRGSGSYKFDEAAQ
jgi:hypothetical protein